MTPKLPPKLSLAIAYIQSLVVDIKRFDLLRHAYAMAYVSLLSLIPSLAAIFALMSLFSPLFDQDSNAINDIRTFILQHLASASGEQAIEYMESFISNLDFKKIGITGFAGTMVSLILLLKHIEVALNKIFQVLRPRNMVTRFVNFWTFLTLGSFSLALFVGTVSNFAGNESLGAIAQLIGNLANNIVLIIMFALLYKLVPNCQVNTKWALVGGLFSSILLSIAATLMKSYVVLFSNYSIVYGAALAALPIFLIWLYVIWLIILLGALVTWRLQNRMTLRRQSLDSDLAPKSPFKVAKLKLELPFEILSLCHEKFNEGNGEGLSKEEIPLQLNVPLYWIEEFLELLLEKNLILSERNGDEGMLIYPKRPASALKKDEIAKVLES